MKEKHCKGCRQNLPIYNFTKSKMVKDGYENKCRKCRQEARKKFNNTCEVCGTKFKSTKKETRFCGSDCQGSVRRRRVIKKCSYCNGNVEVVRAKSKKHEHYYCDQKCRTEHLKHLMKGEGNPNYNRVVHDCDGCGKKIKVIPSKLEEQKYVFCSNECYKDNIGKYFTGDKNHNFIDFVQLECDGCGEVISRKPGEINVTGKNYCSKSCHIKHQFIPTGINYYKHECLECNRIFQTQVKDSKYCSRDCKNAYQSKHNRGKNHPLYNPDLTDEEREVGRNYTEYYDWRLSVFKRDNHTCQCCGDGKGGNLVAHHIYNYSEHKELRTDLKNGITLCKDCHRQFHSKYGFTNNNKKQLEQFIKNHEKASIPL